MIAGPAHLAARRSFTGTDVSTPTWSPTWPPGQHTPSPSPPSLKLKFPFRQGAGLGRRASTLGRWASTLGRWASTLGRWASTLGRHAPFLLTEPRAREARYSAVHACGVSDAKHACVVLCFQLLSRCSSASRFERARQSENSNGRNSADGFSLEVRLVRVGSSVCRGRFRLEVRERERQKSSARATENKGLHKRASHR